MADYGYKVLGQAAPLATTETLLYSVPASTQAVISTFVCCNRGIISTSFHISISTGGVATTDKDYIYYDVVIPKNETFVSTIGVTLAATDVVRVWAGNANLSFSIFGSEYA